MYQAWHKIGPIGCRRLLAAGNAWPSIITTNLAAVHHPSSCQPACCRAHHSQPATLSLHIAPTTQCSVALNLASALAVVHFFPPFGGKNRFATISVEAQTFFPPNGGKNHSTMPAIATPILRRSPPFKDQHYCIQLG